MSEFLTDPVEIRAWLDEMGITRYDILPDSTVNVRGLVDLESKQLDRIPVKFNTVTGGFDCDSNLLTSLVGCPETVSGSFHCTRNKLTSLIGMPSSVGLSVTCHNNQLTDLTGLASSIGANTVAHGVLSVEGNDIKSGVLGLILVEGLGHVYGLPSDVLKIIRPYLRKPEDIFACQQELIDAGFDEYAQL